MAERSRGPRDRMVFSAAQLIRSEGVSATGLRAVVEHADAPRGSIQHYFPGGKQQLMNEAVTWGSDYASARIDRYMAGTTKQTPSRLFAVMTQQWIDEFRDTGFRGGCPLAAATVDCAATVESTRLAVAAGFHGWRSSIEGALRGMGVPPRRCAGVATLMLSALEGAIIIARAEHHARALHTVTRELGPVLDGYVR